MRTLLLLLILGIGLSAAAAPAKPPLPGLEPTGGNRRHLVFYEQASAALKRCDYSTVIDSLEKSVRIRPNSRAYILLGRVYMQVEQLDNAEAAFHGALEVLPRLSPEAKSVARFLKEIAVRRTTQLKVTSSPSDAVVYLDWVKPFCEGDCADNGLPDELTDRADPASPQDHDRSIERHRRLGTSGTPARRTQQRRPSDDIGSDLIAACPRGNTPLIISTTPGAHRMVIKGDAGHDPAVLPEVFVVEGQFVEIDKKLKPKGCDVALSVSPPDTDVEIDGAQPVATPKLLRVLPGEHELVFKKSGFKPRSRTVLCKDFKHRSLIETLTPDPTGVLVLSKTPGNFQVRIDDKKLSGSSLSRIRVALGEHRVEVSSPGYYPWQETVQVRREDEEIEVTPKLVVIPPYVEKVPVYRKGWLWGVIGSAVAAGGGGVAYWQLREPPLPVVPNVGTIEGR